MVPGIRVLADGISVEKSVGRQKVLSALFIPWASNVKKCLMVFLLSYLLGLTGKKHGD